MGRSRKGDVRSARSERLLELIQVLRGHRRPVSGHTLAEELGVSRRTVYRDIQTLIAQGASIDGEAGVGFVLPPEFVLALDPDGHRLRVFVPAKP